jgi:hypothetical protein
MQMSDSSMKSVLDSCWYTFGKSLYAKDVSVINDGKISGHGTVFIAWQQSKTTESGLLWLWLERTTEVSMIIFNTGGMEEFGGWFTSLNVQYLDEDGRWVSAQKTTVNRLLCRHQQCVYSASLC